MSDLTDWEARSKELEEALEDALEELDQLAHRALPTHQKRVESEIRRLKEVLSPSDE